VIRLTLEEEHPADITHCTVRAMAAGSCVLHPKIHQTWRHGLAPSRSRQFRLSQDPTLVAKAADVVGLCVDPPKRALVPSIDEKSQTQIPDRAQPGLPMKPGGLGTTTHDYKRNGTTTQAFA
jgi:hypothetical protein